MRFSKVAILGAGLLGGSIARALSAQKTICGEVCLWARRQETIEEVKSAGLLLTATTDLRLAVEDAEVIILAMTIGSMGEILAKAKPFISPFAVITDVGSVKARVCREMQEVLGDSAHFVGSHPMAGSEQSGFAHSRADLLENAVCIVTPDVGTDPAALGTVKDFWSLLGMRILELPPDKHDQIVGQISHLPHLTAACLVNAAIAGGEESLKYSGGGFRDSTRVAEGPSAMWAEILMANRLSVMDSLQAMKDQIEKVGQWLEKEDKKALQAYLEKARECRSKLRPGKGHE